VTELDYKERWAPKNWCFWTVVLEKTLESPLHCKEIQPVHPKGNQSWIFIGRTEAEAPIFGHLMQRTDSLEETLMLERLKAGEGANRGWVGWMASPTWWTWIWVISGSWWWTGKPGVLQSMGSQRVRHDCVPELNWCNPALPKVFLGDGYNINHYSLIQRNGGRDREADSWIQNAWSLLLLNTSFSFQSSHQQWLKLHFLHHIPILSLPKHNQLSLLAFI